VRFVRVGDQSPVCTEDGMHCPGVEARYGQAQSIATTRPGQGSEAGNRVPGWLPMLISPQITAPVAAVTIAAGTSPDVIALRH
jgi:hypothetical protein